MTQEKSRECLRLILVAVALDWVPVGCLGMYVCRLTRVYWEPF